MSENSEEKTNRKLSKLIKDEYFKFEYSIFPDIADLMNEIAKEQATTLVLEYSNKIKSLIRKNKDYAFLVRWRRNQRIYNFPDLGDRSIDQLYMMIYSPIELNELISFCKTTHELNCLYRKSNQYNKFRAVKRIQAKKNPMRKSSDRSDVNAISPKKIKLYTIINKERLKALM